MYGCLDISLAVKITLYMSKQFIWRSSKSFWCARLLSKCLPIPGHLYFLPRNIDVIYYYIIWTDNGSMLPEADTLRQEGKYPMIKVLRGCILKLVLILYRTGNMQSAVLLSFIVSSSLLPRGLQSTHPPMPCYNSPYVVYNIYVYMFENSVKLMTVLDTGLT